ncbi:hypothetical protein [Pseudotabrizicola algicola]|uniref:Uncharacterized protein n=1 Tax=Pseudotabrizicola algicola TaxID=2709381 RepID=A0A6B3RQY0_9RHOB|nr:hypothetical protein [Pseudotabrizicola algicola]NEX47566.1 hypothetical protein [Pseudotabrizicola algicola]
MTALPSQSMFHLPTHVTALARARAATPDYCNSASADKIHAPLRALTPIEAMYAYFGSDEALD